MTAEDPLMRAVLRDLWWRAASADVDLGIRHMPGAMLGKADKAFNSTEAQDAREKFERTGSEPRKLVPSDMLALPFLL